MLTFLHLFSDANIGWLRELRTGSPITPPKQPTSFDSKPPSSSSLPTPILAQTRPRLANWFNHFTKYHRNLYAKVLETNLAAVDPKDIEGRRKVRGQTIRDVYHSQTDEFKDEMETLRIAERDEKEIAVRQSAADEASLRQA